MMKSREKARQVLEMCLNNWSINKTQIGGTSCPEQLAFPADMPHPLQMLNGNPS